MQMKRAISERLKPHVTIASIGSVDHGKTSLLKAITAVQAKKGLCREYSYDYFNLCQCREKRDVHILSATLEYETENRRYDHVDCFGHMDFVKYMLYQAAELNGVILVVSAIDGVMPDTREQVRLVRLMGIAHMVVFLNKCDTTEDEELLDIAEVEIRDLLSTYDYPASDIPIIRGSALKAWEDPLGGWAWKVEELLAVVDNHIPTPDIPDDLPFLMANEAYVEDGSFEAVVMGKVDHGVVRPGDNMEIVGMEDNVLPVLVQSVKMYGQEIKCARTGDSIEVLLKCAEKTELERGQVLVTPGSVVPHSKFRALVYVLMEHEGGRKSPFFSHYRPQFFSRGITDVACLITLPDGIEMCDPGDYSEMDISLLHAVVIELGMRFAICEGGRVRGVGVVTAVFKS